MANCTKTVISIFRPAGKWCYEVLELVWERNLKRPKPLSIRELARKYGEKESTLRYQLLLGMSGGQCGYYLKDKKRWSYHTFSAKLAYKTKAANVANKGPKGKIMSLFVEVFIIFVTKYRSITYALEEMRKQNANPLIPSRSAIYRCVRDGAIKTNLGNWEYYKPYKRKKSKEEERKPKNHNPKRMIDDLSEEAKEHSSPGHYQMDTVVSCQDGSGGLLVVYDPYRDGLRRAFVRRVRNLKRRTIACALNSIVEEIHMLNYPLKSILTDNGNVFLDTQKLESIAKVSIYYCHPYRACEKGAVERLSRLIRRFYPKSTNFKKTTKAEIRILQERLVRYPRTSRKAG